MVDFEYRSSKEGTLLRWGQNSQHFADRVSPRLANSACGANTFLNTAQLRKLVVKRRENWLILVLNHIDCDGQIALLNTTSFRAYVKKSRIAKAVNK